jgi:RND family efflux transporter MFP subunit
VGDRLENMGGGDPAFRIVDNRLLYLTVSVPSSRLSRVTIGQRLEFTTDAIPGETFSGKVAFINPSIDQASRSAKVIAEVPNANGRLRGGSFVKGRIVVASRPGVLQVAREALLNWDVEQGAADVFIVKTDTVEKRQVKLGAVGAEAVEVLSGLAAGDQVVTRGALTLGPGDKVSVSKGSGE